METVSIWIGYNIQIMETFSIWIENSIQIMETVSIWIGYSIQIMDTFPCIQNGLMCGQITLCDGLTGGDDDDDDDDDDRECKPKDWVRDDDDDDDRFKNEGLKCIFLLNFWRSYLTPVEMF